MPKPKQEKLLDLGEGLELWIVHIDALREQAKNAQAMTPKMFNGLAKNIQDSGRLEQFPFCAAQSDGDDVRIELVSGHHRVRAARKAGVLQIYVLVDNTGLSRSQIVSKQLSHNAIVGNSDDDMLAQLFTEMDNLEDMIASHIDPVKLGIAQPLQADPLQSISVDFQGKTIVFTFLPTQIDDFVQACGTIPPDAELVNVLPLETYDKFSDALKTLGKKCDIRSIGAIVSKMCDIATEWCEHFEPDEAGRADLTKPKADKVNGTIARAKLPAERAMAALLRAQQTAGIIPETQTEPASSNGDSPAD